jgi:uncharacterized protein
MNALATVERNVSASRYRRFHSSIGEHLLVVPQSRIYDLGDVGSMRTPTGTLDPVELDGLVNSLIDTIDLRESDREPLSSVVVPAPQSISLNVSSSCNLSCAYCYAARGNFDGAQSQPMTFAIACDAIDSLLAKADASVPITVGFMGGEPFVNRRLIHQVVAYAVPKAAARLLDLRFSVTTNGTLLREDDLQMLRGNRFAVTVSIDGGAQTHERLRPIVNGHAGSHSRLRAAIAPLLRDPGHAQIAARATVTRFDMNATRTFDSILQLGFAEAGFAPLKSGPDGSGPLRDGDWAEYLDGLTSLARRELQAALQGGPVRLTNFAVALKQLHRGACSPYPCGAGGGYFSVAANGDWYTCHRAIGNKAFHVGDSRALDPAKRLQFLTQRHVHAKSDCNACWARYLCSGSCHQEAALRTPQSCDFVRGWLDFCLAAYCELSMQRPEFFTTPTPVSLALNNQEAT